jgi:hypothetical protein
MNQQSSNSEKLFLDFARCPMCLSNKIKWYKTFAKCEKCHAWYPIINNAIELVPDFSEYKDDKSRVLIDIEKSNQLKLNLNKKRLKVPQSIQRKHFDSYAIDSTQSYDTYEMMPFWKILDHI